MSVPFPPTHNREPYDTLLYCPTSCSYRSVCGTEAACRLQFPPPPNFSCADERLAARASNFQRAKEIALSRF